MQRIANSILDLTGGYSVSKAVDAAKRYGKPLLLMPETVYPDPFRIQHRLAVYAVDAEFAEEATEKLRITEDEWLYTNCIYLVEPLGRLYKSVAYNADAVDP